MAPHGEALTSSFSRSTNTCKSQRLSSDHLQRTISDISFDLSKEEIDMKLPPISEVEDAKCECCGMSEECTTEYIDKVRDKFLGKWVCGLCAEAVKEESEKHGGKIEEALNAHIACVRFNKYGRTFPVLFQAEAMKEMLRKSKLEGRLRAKCSSHRNKGSQKKSGISRSSSCIPSITREMNDLTRAN